LSRYAELFGLLTLRKYDVAEEVIATELKNREVYMMFMNAYTKQNHSDLLSHVKKLFFDSFNENQETNTDTSTENFDANDPTIINPMTLIDLMELLSQGNANFLHYNHTEFKYKRTGLSGLNKLPGIQQAKRAKTDVEGGTKSENLFVPAQDGKALMNDVVFHQSKIFKNIQI
jgi:hypothetical protein